MSSVPAVNHSCPGSCRSPSHTSREVWPNSLRLLLSSRPWCTQSPECPLQKVGALVAHRCSSCCCFPSLWNPLCSIPTCPSAPVTRLLGLLLSSSDPRPGTRCGVQDFLYPAEELLWCWPFSSWWPAPWQVWMGFYCDCTLPHIHYKRGFLHPQIQGSFLVGSSMFCFVFCWYLFSS